MKKNVKNKKLRLSKRLFNDFVRPNYKLLFCSIFFALLSGICTLVVVKLIKPIIDDIFINKNNAKLLEVSTLFLLSSVFKGIGDYGESYYLIKFAQIITKEFQLKTFSHLIKCDLEYFHMRPTGKTISILSNDINAISNSIKIVVLNFGKDIFVLTGIIIYLIIQDPIFAMVACCGFIFSVFPTFRIGRKVRSLSSFTHEKFGDWVSFISQIFHGIRLVKTYNMEKYEIAKADEISSKIYDLSMKSARVRSITHPIMELVMGLAISSIIFIGGWLVIEGIRTSGTLLSLLAAIMFAYQPAKSVFNAGTLFQESMAAAARIYQVLDVVPNIQEIEKENDFCVNKGEIKFENVNFSYSNGIEVLQNLSFKISPGEKIAIVGPSGSGKSTIINLIPRLYDAKSGKIHIDGHNIKEFSLHNLRKGISLVSQDITLFNDTVYENIAYGNQKANMEEIIQAAKSAEALDFINKLPNKFETVVGDNGVLLSGGQKQRISIARAILKNSPILLLDEATSALDSESELNIQKALDNLMVGKTTLIVAHRLSTIENSDRILVLSYGKIVEQGRHEDLIEKNGIYFHLYNKSAQEKR